MQILGKKSKLLLIAVAIAMLTALGLSFALWDTNAVKAASGEISEFANAKVGDIVTFGQYYQTGDKDASDPTEYEKTPIEWIVVDKDERTGQLTLMSRYILATGSFFGNWYYSASTKQWKDYDASLTGPAACNQAYVDSTVRAYLNNLERLDIGGDKFISGKGYMPSYTNSSQDTGLLSSIGYSNQRYWTWLNYGVSLDKALVDAGDTGLHKRFHDNEIYFERPIDRPEYKNRPVTRGFYDDAFSEQEKSMIAPKIIAGYTGHRWPDSVVYDVSAMSYIEGAYDKVWLPSVTELNIKDGVDWNDLTDDRWTLPSDESGSTEFEYFKNYRDYGFTVLADAIKTKRTPFATDAARANFSLPLYERTNADRQSLTVFNDIDGTTNSSDHYWTRSPVSYRNDCVRTVEAYGNFSYPTTDKTTFGVRPCINIKY